MGKFISTTTANSGAGLVLAGCLGLGVGISASITAAQAQSSSRLFNTLNADIGAPYAPTLNQYGAPGLIDMPSGEAMPDGELSFSFGYFGLTGRAALGFQITPRLSASFRYTGVDSLNLPGSPFINVVYYDRSFDLRYQVLRESTYLPAVTVGLQDFLGTGLYSGEYIAATKNITPKLKLTAGLGWGRLSKGGTRPLVGGTGGNVNFDQWFTGSPSVFGGLEYQVSDRLSVTAEYSGDDYLREASNAGLFNRQSDFNFGAKYRVSARTTLGAYYMYGSEVGLSLTYTLNPKRPKDIPLLAAPAPINPRPDRARNPDAWATTWVENSDAPRIVRDVLSKALTRDGIVLESLSLGAYEAELRYRNTRYRAEAIALGRAARAMANVLPASVEIFHLVPMERGLATSRTTLKRADLEELEYRVDGAETLLARAEIGEASAGSAANAIAGEGLYPKFIWGVTPYVEPNYFDPDSPVLLDFGVRASARYQITPGLSIQGAVSKTVINTMGSQIRPSTSVLQHVRTDGLQYKKQGDPGIDYLTAAYYFRPAQNLYGRITAGYLESMFAGVSTEVLWKPVNSRFALGAEVNYVAQRDFDRLFGLQNYSLAMGHISGYWDMGNGFTGQLDVGRYLAGDYGATLSIDREFKNGWRVGAFATLTDVSAADFGEGSFDKGIRITIPLEALLGNSNKQQLTTTLRPLTRDGGAKLNVEGRLYESVRASHAAGIQSGWGRVWK